MENNTEISSPFNEILDDIEPKNNGLMTEIRTDSGSKVDGSEIQEIISNTRGTEAIHCPLKRKLEIGRQGSQDSPLVIDSDTDDTESEDDNLVWKRQKLSYFPAGGQGKHMFLAGRNEADGEVNGAEFKISSDVQSEGDDSTSEIRNSESCKPHRPDCTSTSSKLADRVKAQSVAKVGGDREWGIHGIIGKEVIGGKVYYCVDWLPTMIPVDELKGAERLVREFEKTQFRKAGKRKRRA
ncbi:hypothetical protein FGG08_000493 [Glutinoglossum americanum]|uniref:Uncharacterized protein n=1 Tax=Glutinoglossum americanum TaxID=1670608 RepID=A0A9P8IA93_9PEZI|nr:hypothetical protein FGG08_000493 [Glutinoglossum americanum]